MFLKAKFINVANAIQIAAPELVRIFADACIGRLDRMRAVKENVKDYLEFLKTLKDENTQVQKNDLAHQELREISKKMGNWLVPNLYIDQNISSYLIGHGITIKPEIYNDHELRRTVMAHELGHYFRMDGLPSLVNYLFKGELLCNDTIQNIDSEKNCDEMGVDALSKCEFDFGHKLGLRDATVLFCNMLITLEALYGEQDGSTHPATDNRIRNLVDRCNYSLG